MTEFEHPALLSWPMSGAAPLVGFTFLIFRKPYSPVQWLLYYYNLAVVHLLWRAKLPQRLPIPEGQGAVIICNHRSSVDPCIIQAVARIRLVHWMVAQIYGQNSFIGWLLKLSETIPVQRHGGDVSPTKKAIRLASRGGLVGIFPEGRINTTDAFMLKVRPGAVLVALKARVPILPCYIEGSPYHKRLWRPLFMLARVRMTFGHLIDLSEYYGREREEGLIGRLTIEAVHEIAKLAGQEDFEPELAGRNWAPEA